jgi:hypothetical protein
MPAIDVETRTSEQGRIFTAETVQGFILAALSHEATVDQVDLLLYRHVVEGRYHPSVVTESLRPIIDDVLQAAAAEDWSAVARRLTAEAQDALGIDEEESAG